MRNGAGIPGCAYEHGNKLANRGELERAKKTHRAIFAFSHLPEFQRFSGDKYPVALGGNEGMHLNPMFSDGLVLQANQPVRIFGEGGGTVRVEFCGQTVQNTFCGTKWMVELEPLDYGGPYEMKVTLGNRQSLLNDVYIGDVYLIAGQSNMQWKLSEIGAPEEYADNPLLRLFSTTRVQGGERFDPVDGWVRASTDTAGDFSAIGYLCGQRLQRETGHAIGLVSLYQGAAAIQCFLPSYVFEQNPRFVIPAEERFDMTYPWNAHPSILFDFALTRISPFSFGGVVWYQGESNCSEAESRIYHDLLHWLITSWRKELCSDTLPFVVIQIHDYLPRDTENWHMIQKAQENIANEEELVETVITKDVCETNLIHPLHKKEIANRVAQALTKLMNRRP